ncbi:hypothetical protein M1D89_20300 [Arthrobacter sp. D3-18]
MKFRLGDHVRVINRDSAYFDRVGRVTVIDKADTDGEPFGVIGLSRTYPQFRHWYGPEELTLAEKEDNR